MSDELKNDSVVVEQEQEQDQAVDQPVETQKDQIVNEDKELYNSLKNDFEEMKKSMSAWQEKEKVYKNQIKGLDRKNTELSQKVKQLTQKEMSAEEIIEQQRKELEDGFKSLWCEKAVAINFSDYEEEEQGILKTYVYGNNEEEQIASAKSLRDIMDKKIKDGISKGVEEKLAQGYKPKSSGVQGQGVKTLQDMTNQELAQLAKDVVKMPSGKDKDEKLKALAEEEDRRRRELY